MKAFVREKPLPSFSLMMGLSERETLTFFLFNEGPLLGTLDLAFRISITTPTFYISIFIKHFDSFSISLSFMPAVIFEELFQTPFQYVIL